jgi:hypothetical protein
LFINCILDLNEDSRIDMFKKQILKLKPSQLTLKGYECFKLYFLKVNEHENKIYNRNDDFVSISLSFSLLTRYLINFLRMLINMILQVEIFFGTSFCMQMMMKLPIWQLNF